MSNENESSSDEIAQSDEAASAGDASGQPPAAEDAPERAEPAADSAQNSGQESAGAQSDEEKAAAAADDEERRRAYRLNKVLGATLTSTSGDSKAARLFIIDISASGFRATDHQPHTEEQYDISVVLDKNKEPFQSRMRVVWTKELTVSGMFQMGCEFVDPAPEEVQKLEAFITLERKKAEPVKAPVDLGRPWTMIR